MTQDNLQYYLDQVHRHLGMIKDVECYDRVMNEFESLFDLVVVKSANKPRVQWRQWGF